MSPRLVLTICNVLLPTTVAEVASATPVTTIVSPAWMSPCSMLPIVPPKPIEPICSTPVLAVKAMIWPDATLPGSTSVAPAAIAMVPVPVTEPVTSSVPPLAVTVLALARFASSVPNPLITPPAFSVSPSGSSRPPASTSELP